MIAFNKSVTKGFAMILYDLRCATGHGFEAWFRNSDAYDQQRAADAISCPFCGDSGISKAPMAPRIGRAGRRRQEQAPPAEAPSAAIAGDADSAFAGNSGQMRPEQMRPEQMRPEQMRMVMTRIAALNKHINETCDYVGHAFPEEARKIHYGETPHRDIYGEASPEEAAELKEEGVEIATIPWLRRGDS
jgi:hypothetical protein